MKARDVREYLHDYIDSMDKKELKRDHFCLDVYVEEDEVAIYDDDLDSKDDDE
mgnify:CR=1 FL=1